ncbi:hypothetical protein D3C71_2246040 [compost metagenome]
MLPLTVHTEVVVLANTTGLVDAPGVAETAKVPPGAYTGEAGLAAKSVMAWLATVMATSSRTCGAAA